MRRQLIQLWNDFKHLKLGIPRFEVCPGDRFVCSWPRSGNTWMRYMLSHALRPVEEWDLMKLDRFMPPVNHNDIGKLLPAMAGQPHRVFKSHEPYLRHYLVGKAVYIVRDCRDAVVSYHHYQASFSPRPVNLRDFVHRSISNRVTPGSWSSHVRSWLAQDHHPRLLIVRYEDMVADPARELGRTFDHFEISVPQTRVRAAAEWATIDRVNRGFQDWARQMRQKAFTGGLGGGVGRGRKLLDEATTELLMADAGQMLRRLGYV